MRITERVLENTVARLNEITKSPATSYTKTTNGKYTANVGNYHLSWAYGGVTLHRMHNTSGGVEDVLDCGHVPKRELYVRMLAFEQGFHAKNQ